MSRLILRLLLRLEPETAHRIGTWLLKAYQFIRFRLARSRIAGAAAVHVRGLPDLKFSSRIGLAGGFDKNAEVFAALASFGFGFIEVGTITPQPQPGNPRPRIRRVGGNALWNHLGFNNAGVERAARNLERYRASVPDLPLFANVGKGRETPPEAAPEDYATCVRRLRPWTDGFVINVSSPNTPGLRDLQTEAFLERLAAALPADVRLFLKLAPDLDDERIAGLAAYVAQSRAYHGLVLCNTSRHLAERVAGEPRGGLSGAPLFERALECVAIARERLGDKTLIGVGGIASVEDGRRMRAAGADLIEVYTAFVYQGPALIRRLAADPGIRAAAQHA